MDKKVVKKLQALTGKSKVSINWIAWQYVNAGLVKSHAEALEYMMEIYK